MDLRERKHERFRANAPELRNSAAYPLPESPSFQSDLLSTPNLQPDFKLPCWVCNAGTASDESWLPIRTGPRSAIPLQGYEVVHIAELQDQLDTIADIVAPADEEEDDGADDEEEDDDQD